MIFASSENIILKRAEEARESREKTRMTGTYAK
jgi:hypothetical protein